MSDNLDGLVKNGVETFLVKLVSLSFHVCERPEEKGLAHESDLSVQLYVAAPYAEIYMFMYDFNAANGASRKDQQISSYS